MPALVTTGPAPMVIDSTPGQITGSLGRSDTTVLFGNGNVADDARSGGRFRVGWWFDDDHTVGIDGSFFFLGQATRNFSATSFGSPALFRPFLNSGFTFVPGTGFVGSGPFQDAEAVAFPGALAGTVDVRQTSKLWGYDANLRTNLCNGCCKGFGYTIDGYAGFRSLTLDETLQIDESLASLLPGRRAASPSRTSSRLRTPSTAGNSDSKASCAGAAGSST